MNGKKKNKDTFQEFSSNEKSTYTTIKNSLKSVLHNHKEVQPVITNLVFEMNDLMRFCLIFLFVWVFSHHKLLIYPPIAFGTFIGTSKLIY